jgi:hypothetical protein
MRALLIALLLAAALPEAATAQQVKPRSAGSNRVQSAPSPSEALAAALSRSDAGALANLCADRIDLTLDGVSTVYTRAQVAYVLDTWLDEHPPRLVRFGRHTSGGSDALMATGVLVHDAGEVDVTARLVRGPRGWEVRALHFSER